MGQLVDNLILGFSVALTLQNLMYCFLGVFLGTMIGVLPGIGPLATMAMLLPLTLALPPVSALIMLAGIYYGSDYGGSTTSILVNLPGEGSSVVTLLDGHPMAQQGRAGPALSIAAMGSFFAGCVGTLLIAFVGPPLAYIALNFGSPEYFSLMLMALVCASVVGTGSLLKSLAMVVAGLLIGIVGTDLSSGKLRYNFGIPELSDGVGIAVVAMGFFGITEIIRNLAGTHMTQTILRGKIQGLLPRWEDLKIAFGPILRGASIGAAFGPLPGLGGTVSAFTSYLAEKKLAKDPSRFGKGAIEGVAGPETANNACAQTTFVPMLTLGIPGSASMALMLSAMIMHGITPGPQVMTSRPDLFWGLIASMWIGNAMLLVLNLPLIGIWIKLLRVPYRVLFPIIMTMMGIGIYSLNSSGTDVLLMAFFGFVGYVLAKLGCSFPPLILAMVLGPLMEENLRRSLLLSEGDPAVFFTRPISGGFMAATALLLMLFIVPAFRKRRKAVIVEEAAA
ncbi:MAG TPA: tripartite tricarboxylate transporter permease [Burkholderiales bacterium]|nr:tripartite tricarboxylate transporter permease [Burkholderiales bacterium]